MLMRCDGVGLGLLSSSLPSLLHLVDTKQKHILFWFMPG